MPGRKIVLFRFKIPEIAQLPPDEQERIIDLCWRSVPVQEAWKRYWSRPFQLLLVPIVLIALYWSFANKSPGVLLAIILPVTVMLVFTIRTFYRKRLTEAVRQVALAQLRGEQLPIDETVPKLVGSASGPAAGTEAESASPRFVWRQHRTKLILIASLW